MADEIMCPACGQAGQVEKVSTVYLVGSERRRSASDGPLLVSQAPAWLQKLSSAERWALSRRLAPPSSGKQEVTRPLHPDLVVITFSLILPFFIAGILNTQPAMLLPVLILILGVYGVYFWKRKAILARFAGRQAVQRAGDQRARDAIARWMQLYYCAQDDGIFIPGDRELTPADQMPGYLLSPPTHPVAPPHPSV